MVAISDQEIPRLFERFGRGHTAHKEGSGLGLAICLEICQRYGYLLTLENDTQNERQGIRTSLTLIPDKPRMSVR